MPVLMSLLEGYPHRIDTAHLPGADSECLPASGEHYRVRRHVPDHRPGEEEIAPRRLADLTADDLHLAAFVSAGVAVLHEQTAEHPLVVALVGLEGAPLEVVEDPRACL